MYAMYRHCLFHPIIGIIFVSRSSHGWYTVGSAAAAAAAVSATASPASTTVAHATDEQNRSSEIRYTTLAQSLWTSIPFTPWTPLFARHPSTHHPYVVPRDYPPPFATTVPAIIGATLPTFAHIFLYVRPRYHSNWVATWVFTSIDPRNTLYRDDEYIAIGALAIYRETVQLVGHTSLQHIV